MSEYNEEGAETPQNNEPGPSTGIMRSPVSILYGLKKARKQPCNEEASKSQPQKKRPTVEEEETGVTYPIDIWFLIADHIEPEYVGKFALICKDTLAITDDPVFWIRLYKRYYRDDVYLNASLRPNTLKERFGLKTRVIRALHTMYEPLIMRRETSLKLPTVRNRQVMRQWFEVDRTETEYTYFFEMRDVNYHRRFIPEFEEYLEDISMNPAEGCFMLKLTCLQRLQMPLLLGLSVREAKLVKENGDFVFKGVFLEENDNVHIVNVNLGPVIRTRFVNWWSPRYPHVLPISLDNYDCP